MSVRRDIGIAIPALALLVIPFAGWASGATIRKARAIAQLLALSPVTTHDVRSIIFCTQLREFFTDACTLGRQRDTGAISFRAARARIPKRYTRLYAICALALPHPESQIFRNSS